MVYSRTSYYELDRLAKQRILVLDGAMGTMIQQYGLGENDFRGELFSNHSYALKGCNDLLNLTQPRLIESLHLAYLGAGADILTTNTFNANSISLNEYGLTQYVPEINKAAVACARRAIDSWQHRTGRGPCFIAGSIGPTNRTASISPDVSNPAHRAVTFDELRSAYYEQIRALVEAGVDILLAETSFDTLNLKACLFAIEEYFEQTGCRLPVIASATITDRSGRTLSGQTIEAFYISVAHANLFAVGINCALGPELMRPYVEALSRVAPIYTSCHPNAGLPNEMGGYDETPQQMAAALGEFARNGWVNIVGGCCGTTPAHIEAIAAAVRYVKPRIPPKPERFTCFSGLEPLVLRPENPFVLIGERTNVSGSRRFAQLIREGKFEEALTIARQQVEGGANIIDVNLDDALLDAETLMPVFLRYIASDPEVARVPVMIDSSKWSVLEAGLKCVQGKSIVNSISMKEGEEEFLRQARRIRRYGAACVVMLFDERGQAVTVEHRIEIAQRAWHLLTEKAGFPPEDIIIDPNILAVATGIEEHNRYAINFLEATRQIKQLLPGVKISGGVSNLSFSFRGIEPVRRAMHSVFLYHAIRAGMDMGIVNAGQLDVYEEIPSELRERVEDVLFDRRPDATERLLEMAAAFKNRNQSAQSVHESWRQKTLEERLIHAVIHGISDYLHEDLEEARGKYPSCLSIIEGPLMEGMQFVGELFGQGKMFLPQVVKSARAMKQAVAYLTPFMEAEKSRASSSPGEENPQRAAKHRGTIVLATVKGDVHDIGKNIVGIVLQCNGFRVLDLGIMVPCENILEAARAERADIIGLSGLITPSLEEMVHVAQEMERLGFEIPLLIGGATTSPKHTAVKIAPAYRGPVVHVPDASRSAGVVERLLHPEKREQFLQENRRQQAREVDSYQRRQQAKLISYREAFKRCMRTDWASLDIPEPCFLGIRVLADYPLEELVEYIDWTPFFWVWELRGKYPKILDDPEVGVQARQLLADARKFLEEILQGKLLRAAAVYGFWPANSDGDDIILFSDRGRCQQVARLYCLRQQWERVGQNEFLSLADFIAPLDSGRADYLGMFALTAGHGADELVSRLEAKHDDYRAIMARALADRLAEAFAERLHELARRDWGYGIEERLSKEDLIAERYRGIRPTPGYPAQPDHTEKKTIFKLLQAQELAGIKLTETMAMDPAASICGLYFSHPKARYFAVDRLGRDQVEDYARRKGMNIEEVERWLSPNLGYQIEKNVREPMVVHPSATPAGQTSVNEV